MEREEGDEGEIKGNDKTSKNIYIVIHKMIEHFLETRIVIKNYLPRDLVNIYIVISKLKFFIRA